MTTDLLKIEMAISEDKLTFAFPGKVETIQFESAEHTMEAHLKKYHRQIKKLIVDLTKVDRWDNSSSRFWDYARDCREKYRDVEPELIMTKEVYRDMQIIKEDKFPALDTVDERFERSGVTFVIPSDARSTSPLPVLLENQVQQECQGKIRRVTEKSIFVTLPLEKGQNVIAEFDRHMLPVDAAEPGMVVDYRTELTTDGKIVTTLRPKPSRELTPDEQAEIRAKISKYLGNDDLDF